jgi:hypothetical protein
VTGDKIDAVRGQASFGFIQITTATNPSRDLANESFVAAHEAANPVAIAAVPFRPAKAGEIADLIETCRIPRFGDNR